MMTIRDVTASPDLVSRSVEHAGTKYHLRLLGPDDGEAFGAYLEGLSTATRILFGPHQLSTEEAKRLCATLDPLEVMRYGLFTGDGRMVGYFLLFPLVRSSEVGRFVKAGIELSSATDCTFAPSLADDYQSKGVGSAVMPHIVAVVKSLGFTRMVLCGGTQERNRRGIAFYEKHGFRRIGEFVTESKGERLLNYDMILEVAR